MLSKARQGLENDREERRWTRVWVSRFFKRVIGGGGCWGTGLILIVGLIGQIWFNRSGRV